ncbi:MAG: dockerin type I repeat-containing protein, partial [Oscillospiraceae bacterium]|nr:dockerin type I repeat-containing protein [Oscillospiraceae bacterium]
AEVYDGINTDYMIPVTVTPDGGTSVTASVWVKIGKRGDVNLDHVINVSDSSAIARDVAYFKKNSVSNLDEFGLYLAAPELETKAYPLTNVMASTLAKQLAKNALNRATGEKLERDDVESEYSVSISGASNALPGETVALQVVVEADDSFESLDALIEWDDDTFKSAGAVAVNGTLCESYVEDGMLSIIDYSSGTVHDGAIATIEFKVPEDAVPGSNMEIYFSDIETFAVGNGTSSEDVSNVVNVIGTSIKVLKPSGTTTATTQPTTTTTTTATTVTTTASQTASQETSAATVPVTSSAASSTVSTSQTSVTTSVTTATSATVQTTVTTTVPVTTTTKTSESLVVIPIPRGDANLDGVLDVRDAALIARKLARGESTLLPDIADYNMDGKKNVSDAAAIARYLSVVSVLK